MSNHAAITNRWFEEVWNQGNEATIDEFFSPEGRCYGFPNPDSVINRDEFKATVRQFRTPSLASTQLSTTPSPRATNSFSAGRCK